MYSSAMSAHKHVCYLNKNKTLFLCEQQMVKDRTFGGHQIRVCKDQTKQNQFLLTDNTQLNRK